MARHRFAKARLQVKIDDVAADLYIRNLETKAAMKAATVTRQRIMQNIVSQGRVNTGRMLHSVNVRPDPRPRGKASFVVSVDVPYYKFQNYGTRAHGPVTAKFLVFTPKGSNRVVFAKRVRGIEPGHFSEKARADLTVKDFL